MKRRVKTRSLISPPLPCVTAPKFGQQPRSFFDVELRVRRFHNQQKPVIRRALDPGEVEDRMIKPRQPVQGEHPDQRAESGKQNRQFEHRRNRKLPRKHRLAADHERVIVAVRVPDHEDRVDQPEQAAAEYDVAEDRAGHADRIVDSVDREGRERIQLLVTVVVMDRAARGHQVFRLSNSATTPYTDLSFNSGELVCTLICGDLRIPAR